MSNTHMTDCGAVLADSIIQTGYTGATRGGYVQDCPKTRYKIALRVGGNGWEALYDQGGDDCGISADNLTDIISIGAMDDGNTTDAERLVDGANELRAWAVRIRDIDRDNEALQECADYLIERADLTVVAGFRQWIKAGRCVCKGEHGLTIWVPVGGKKAVRIEEQGSNESETQEDGVSFVLGTVFDISQTRELTEADEVHGGRARNAARACEPCAAVQAASDKAQARSNAGWLPVPADHVSRHAIMPLPVDHGDVDAAPVGDDSKPEKGKQYSLCALSKTGSWKASEVVEVVESEDTFDPVEIEAEYAGKVAVGAVAGGQLQLL